MLKKENQFYLILIILFFAGLFLRTTVAYTRHGGFFTFQEHPKYFIFWHFIWFAVIVCSLIYMHNQAKQIQNQKYVIYIRTAFVTFIILTGILILPYFK